MELASKALLFGSFQGPTVFSSTLRRMTPPLFGDGQHLYQLSSYCSSKTKAFRALVSSPIIGDASVVVGEEIDSTSPGSKIDEIDREDDERMMRIYDKLIEVFLVDKPTPADWRRLIAFSRDWSRIRAPFFARCREQADGEADPELKHKLLRLARKLKEIDEDLQRHDDVVEVVRRATIEERSDIVARRRKDFTTEFFVHLFTVAQSYRDSPEDENALTELGNKLLAAVAAYDNAAKSVEALSSAELKLQDIINSPTLGHACKKIDDLTMRNQPDTALAMILAKAWSSARGTDVTKDEVKDIMYHMYMRAVDHLETQMPKNARIAKHILRIKDPERRLSALNDAFTPGEEFEGHNVDFLYTTPTSFHSWVKSVIDAYHSKRGGSLLREARDLMSPKKIHDLEELKTQIEHKFL